jgi:lactate dehydrogenase-like 2-hydroxyacid dehydrogenase
MRVLYFDENRNDTAEKELGLIYTSLEDLLEKADFVSLHVPLLPSTHHLIGERELRQMKPTAYLINTARGAVVNEQALCRALEEKWIEGAALDVFEDEPRLCEGESELTNLVVTPHIASATREARIEMARMAAQNVIDVLIENKPPTNLVNEELRPLDNKVITGLTGQSQVLPSRG